MTSTGLQQKLYVPALIKKNRFRRNGLIYLVLSPFVACYVIIKAFVGNADTLRRDPAALNSRGWSVRARWQFRECSPV